MTMSIPQPDVDVLRALAAQVPDGFFHLPPRGCAEVKVRPARSSTAEKLRKKLRLRS